MPLNPANRLQRTESVIRRLRRHPFRPPISHRRAKRRPCLRRLLIVILPDSFLLRTLPSFVPLLLRAPRIASGCGNKDKIISADANSTDRKRLRRATYAEVEEALLKWFDDARARNIPISGPMMLAQATDLAFLRRVVERMLIAVDRPAANLPLRVSLYSALEMVKASWAEVTATCVQNCFRMAGFADVGPDADPEASEEDHSGGDLWQRVVDSDMGGRDICWDDFVTADDDADTAEPCTDEGIVNEVRGKSDLEESDDDDDDTLEPAPTSVPVAIGYIDSLRQLVYAKGLGEEHAAALN
ncbi:hypothetical protein HPB50_002376 [Hyalomma asiaticum]|uniref:Uncharacterized protein n=1 Tax=Hyalomma asiaticum TaxID=266040 RepID=A0ACB7TDC5_HYAAI|nr:hypothetical protein HPB50_002376 [Hyalomma asiaticum]